MSNNSKNNKMKQIIGVLLAMSLVLCTACGQKETTSEPEATPQTDVTQPDATETDTPATDTTPSVEAESEAEVLQLDIAQETQAVVNMQATQYNIPEYTVEGMPEGYSPIVYEAVVNSKGIYYRQGYSFEINEFETTNHIIYWNPQTQESEVLYECGAQSDNRSDLFLINAFAGSEDTLVWVEMFLEGDAGDAVYEIRCMNLETGSVETIRTVESNVHQTQYDLNPQVSDSYVVWYEANGIFCYSLADQSVRQIGEDVSLYVENGSASVQINGTQCVYAAEENGAIRIIEENLADGTRQEYAVPAQCGQVESPEANEKMICWEKRDGDSYTDNGAYIYVKATEQLYFMANQSDSYLFDLQLGTDNLFLNATRDQNDEILVLSPDTLVMAQLLTAEGEQGGFDSFICTDGGIMLKVILYEKTGYSRVYAWER